MVNIDRLLLPNVSSSLDSVDILKKPFILIHDYFL